MVLGRLIALLLAGTVAMSDEGAFTCLGVSLWSNVLAVNAWKVHVLLDAFKFRDVAQKRFLVDFSYLRYCLWSSRYTHVGSKDVDLMRPVNFIANLWTVRLALEIPLVGLRCTCIFRSQPSKQSR